MAKNLITPGQALRRIISREVASIYSFFGKGHYFRDLIVNGISKIMLSNEWGEKNNFIIGVDKEEDVLSNLNSNSLFFQKSVIVVKNSKKIRSKSVAVILTFEFFASIKIFDKIGSVDFFSIMPYACPIDFKKISLFIVNSIFTLKEFVFLCRQHFAWFRYLL